MHVLEDEEEEGKDQEKEKQEVGGGAPKAAGRASQWSSIQRVRLLFSRGGVQEEEKFNDSASSLRLPPPLSLPSQG